MSTLAAPIKTAASDLSRLTIEDIRTQFGVPMKKVLEKIVPALGPFEERFIAHSPFLTIATYDNDGRADCSPRGDHPGFVRVLDKTTLAIPDRLGNNLADSIGNICSNPAVGLLFFIPGLRETLRVNGNAFVTDDIGIRRSMIANDIVPTFAIILEVREVYMHCGKALIRSGLWNPNEQTLADELLLGRESWSQLSVANGKAGAELLSDTVAMEYTELY